MEAMVIEPIDAEQEEGRAESTREMGEVLEGFLRKARAHAKKPRVHIEDEVSLVRDYLELERSWFGSRLSLETEIDADGRSCLVPPLVLLPLFENLISAASTIGTARLQARRIGHRLRIVVESPLDRDVAARSREPESGTEAVRERLASAYGGGAIFVAKRLSGRRLVVISIPVGRAAQGRDEETRAGWEGSPE